MLFCKKKWLCIPALFFVCLVARSPASFAAEKVVAGYASISPSEVTLLTAAKAGLFDKHGLDVKTVYMGGSSRVMEAMVSGDLQIAQIGGTAVLYAKAAGIDVAYIATIRNAMISSIISRPEVKQAADLRGKTLAVTRRGAITDFFGRFALSHFGLTPDKDVKFLYTGGLQATYTALSQGLVAAAVMGAGPFEKRALREGFRQLVDMATLGSDFPFNGLATTQKYLQNHRPTVVRFMKAYLEGIRLNLADKVFTKKVLAGYTGFTEDELLEDAYRIYVLQTMSRVPYPVAQGWKPVMDFAGRENPRVKGVRIEEILDDRIIRELEESGFVKGLGLK